MPHFNFSCSNISLVPEKIDLVKSKNTIFSFPPNWEWPTESEIYLSDESYVFYSQWVVCT